MIECARDGRIATTRKPDGPGQGRVGGMAKVDVKPAHAGTKRGTISLIQVWWRRWWLTHTVVRSVPVFDGKSLVDATGAGAHMASGTPPLRPGRTQHKFPGNGVGEARAIQRRFADALGAVVCVAPVAAPSEPMHKEGKIRRYAPRLLPCHSVHATVWSRRVGEQPNNGLDHRQAPAIVVSWPFKSDAQTTPAGRAPELADDAKKPPEENEGLAPSLAKPGVVSGSFVI